MIGVFTKRNERRRKKKDRIGTSDQLNIQIYLSDYAFHVMELCRYWKSNSIGIPRQGSTEWKEWIDQMYTSARLQSVPITWGQIQALLKESLRKVDYTGGSTAYARLISKNLSNKLGAICG